MKKPRPRCKAPLGPNLARLLADQPQLPRLYRRQRGVWATEWQSVTIRWLGSGWRLVYQSPKVLRSLYTSKKGLLARWLSILTEAAALFRQRTAA